MFTDVTNISFCVQRVINFNCDGEVEYISFEESQNDYSTSEVEITDTVSNTSVDTLALQ